MEEPEDQLHRNRSTEARLRRASARGDVRIHDSSQAGDLVRRLGARAFTAGRDIYVRPELVNPMTSEGAAVLAHELYHVAEQTGLGEAGMPLLRPASAAQGQDVTGGDGPAAGAPVQRATTGLSDSEAHAEAAESSAREEKGGRRRKAEPPDPNLIADRVYELMRRELTLDIERGSYNY